MNDTGIVDVYESSPATEALAEIQDVPSWTEVYGKAEEILAAAKRARANELPYPDFETSKSVAADEIDEQYRDLPEKWKFFYERSIDLPAALAREYQSAKEDITSAHLAEVNTVISAVNHWSGTAKTSFQTNFLNPLVNQTVSCQQLLFDELTVAANAYEGVLRGLLIAGKQLADGVIKVLDTLNDCSAEEFNEALGLIGIGVGIAATVASGGATLPLTLGLIGGGISATQAVIPDDDDKINITHDTVSAVMGELYNEIERCMTYADADEKAIGEGLWTSVENVEYFLSSSDPLTKATLLPHEPTGDGVANLTNGRVPPRGQFHPHD